MTADLHINKPHWLKSQVPSGSEFFRIKRDLREKKLFTVCEEAKCPNIGECWSQGTATFMALGDTCTRGCRFCHIGTGNPGGWLDPMEPVNIAASCELMQLKYMVLTMVDRDDLPDGGAAHLATIIRTVRERRPGIITELLGGDFAGNESALQTVLGTELEVYAHNIETVERLSPRVRDARANYRQSLRMLQRAKELAPYALKTKSSIMVGLGETRDEVLGAMDDLRAHNVDFITVGQYMRPTKKHLPVKAWIHPDEFTFYKEASLERGFLSVASGPLVRSSYKAYDYFKSQRA